MADQPSIRLNKVLRELNISLDRAVEFLAQKGMDVEARPTTKITSKVYNALLDEFQTDKSKKDASHEVSEEKRKEKEDLRVIQEKKEQERLDQIAKREAQKSNRVAIEKPKTLGKIDLDSLEDQKKQPKQDLPKEVGPLKEEEAKTEEITPEVKEKKTLKETIATEKPKVTKPEVVAEVQEKKPEVRPTPATEDETEKETLKTQYQKLSGPKKTGQTINLDEVNKKEKTVEEIVVCGGSEIYRLALQYTTTIILTILDSCFRVGGEPKFFPSIEELKSFGFEKYKEEYFKPSVQNKVGMSIIWLNRDRHLVPGLRK